MNTEEAIKFLKGLIDFFNYPASIRFDSVIDLLKRGEKYEEIVREIVRDIKEINTIQSKNSGLEKLKLIDQILELIKLTEQKYFPKKNYKNNS